MFVLEKFTFINSKLFSFIVSLSFFSSTYVSYRFSGDHIVLSSYNFVINRVFKTGFEMPPLTLKSMTRSLYIKLLLF